MGYGEERASDANIAFAYELALTTCRELWALADQVRSHGTDWMAATETAKVDWAGPKRDQFDMDVGQVRGDVENVAAGIQAAARDIATTWSQARGEQDRINKARYVAAELDDDNWLEDAWEWLAGENDFGPPPDNPPVPGPPGFSPTRAPLYPEWEHRDGR